MLWQAVEHCIHGEDLEFLVELKEEIGFNKAQASERILKSRSVNTAPRLASRSEVDTSG
jgi:hypothetical protein